MEAHTTPEIQRTNLANVVLLLKSVGIDDLYNFDFLDPPPTDTLMRSFELLYALGSFNDRGELTKLGRRQAEFPIDPALSKAILASETFGCTDEVLSIVSMLQESSSIFFRPKEKKLHADKARASFVRAGGDHFTLLNIWEQWVESGYSFSFCMENFVQPKVLNRVRDIRDQLAQLAERAEVVLQSNKDSSDVTPIQKALLSGFFMNTATIQKGGESYRAIKQAATVHIREYRSGLIPS
ncbi:HA2-domain-containing protein [Ceraceosorus guamensis]|uniref:RNA helicase n=1 Tax=Ceraceosorus guamensis TaxID=1522189 RepID=A0A316VT41_9BASI|nr:HA2-domain-containing protein [Ceraceosorus guamensis]PWN40757.1 HA2-domain-containing protein [Ceraceosorus guamensis]